MDAAAEDGAGPRLVTLSFLDSESKLILNRIHDKLESLDQKMGFVTQFLLHKLAADRKTEEPPRKVPRTLSPDSGGPSSHHGSDASTADLERWPDPATLKVEAGEIRRAPLPPHGYEEPEEDPGPPPVPGRIDPASSAMRQFPEEALRRATEKASKSFSSTQPKVFAWQMFRETHTDLESASVKIPLRTSHGEQAEHFLARQTAKVRGIALATLEYFGWAEAPLDFRLAKAKLICSHIKNNAKVRNWTLREGMRNGGGSPRRASPALGPLALHSALLNSAQRSAAALHLLSTATTTDAWDQLRQ